MSDETEFQTELPNQYKPSGAIPFTAMIALLLIGGFVAVALGIVYGIINAVSPFVIITAAATLFWGLALGKALNYCVRFGKIRNGTFVGLAALPLAFISLYSAWVTYFVWFAERPDVFNIWFRLAGAPNFLWGMISDLAARGGGTVCGIDLQGWIAWTVWGLEAIAVTILTASAATEIPEPFCELCDRWTKEVDPKSELLIPILYASHVPSALQEETSDGLEAMLDPQADPNNHLKCVLYGCPTCEESTFVAINSITITVDSDGDTNINNERVCGPALVPFPYFESLRNYEPPERGPATPLDDLLESDEDLFA